MTLVSMAVTTLGYTLKTVEIYTSTATKIKPLLSITTNGARQLNINITTGAVHY